MGKCLTHVTFHPDFLKVNSFYATNIFCWKVLRKLNWQNTSKELQKLPKKDKTVEKVCIFAFQKPNLAQYLTNFSRPNGCTVTHSRNSGFTCHLSPVTCNLSPVTCYKSDEKIKNRRRKKQKVIKLRDGLLSTGTTLSS